MPTQAAELVQLLEKAGRDDLARTVGRLQIVGRCKCGDDFCAMFYTGPPATGAKAMNRETVPLDTDDGHLILDVASGKIVVVEVLYRPGVRAVLDRMAL